MSNFSNLLQREAEGCDRADIRSRTGWWTGDANPRRRTEDESVPVKLGLSQTPSIRREDGPDLRLILRHHHLSVVPPFLIGWSRKRWRARSRWGAPGSSSGGGTSGGSTRCWPTSWGTPLRGLASLSWPLASIWSARPCTSGPTLLPTIESPISSPLLSGRSWLLCCLLLLALEFLSLAFWNEIRVFLYFLLLRRAFLFGFFWDHSPLMICRLVLYYIVNVDKLV